MTNGGVAIVDADQYDRVKGYSWASCNAGFRATYARTSINRRIVMMHVMLFGKRPGFFHDHKNRNGLDNRRENIRWATRSQNQMNIDKPRFRKGTSKFKGVYWMKNAKRWRAKIRKDNTGYTLGTFTDEVMAAQCYDIAARNLFGEFAKTNFPETA